MEVLLAEPDFTIDSAEWRQLNDLLTGPAADLREELITQLEVQDPAAVTAVFDLELRQALAGTAGASLALVELLWRLGYAITELDPNELPEAGPVELYRLAPLHETRLEIASAEIGSFLSRLRVKKSTLSTIATVLTIFSSASNLTGINLSDLAQGGRPDGSPCVVQVDGRVDGSVARLIEKQLPPLPSDCTIKMNVETAEGAHLTATVKGAAID